MIQLKNLQTGSKLGALDIQSNTFDETTQTGKIILSGELQKLNNNVITDNEVKTLKFSEELNELDNVCLNSCKNLDSVEFKGYVKNIPECFGKITTDVTVLGETKKIFKNAPGDRMVIYQTTNNRPILSTDERYERTDTDIYFSHTFDNDVLGEFFKNNTDLSYIKIGTSFTGITDFAFENCTSLKYVYFQDIDQGIRFGTNLFKGCTNLTLVDLPIGIQDLPDHCFDGCIKLEKVYLNNNSTLTKVGKYCFNQCEMLSFIDFPESCTEFDDYAFYGAKFCCYIDGQKHYHTLPTSLTRIGNYCFAGHSYNTTIIDFGDREDMPEIGEHAFNRTFTESYLDWGITYAIDPEYKWIQDNEGLAYVYIGQNEEMNNQYGYWRLNSFKGLKEKYNAGQTEGIYVINYKRAAELLGKNIDDFDSVNVLGWPTYTNQMQIIIPNSVYNNLKDIYFEEVKNGTLVNSGNVVSDEKIFTDEEKSSPWYDVKNQKPYFSYTEYSKNVSYPGDDEDEILNSSIAKEISFHVKGHQCDPISYRIVFSRYDAFGYRYDGYEQNTNKPDYKINCSEWG